MAEVNKESHIAVNEQQPLISERSSAFFAPGGVNSSIFNLTSATLGAGALSVSCAMLHAGVLGGLVMLVIVGLLSVLATIFIIKTIEFTGYKSMEEMAERLGGHKLALFVEFNIIMFCFGTAVGYLISIADIASITMDALDITTVDDLSSWWWSWLLDTRSILAVLTFCILLPLSISDKMEELRFVSLIGVSAIFLLAFAVTYQFFLKGISVSLKPLSEHVVPPNNFELMKAFSLLIFAYSNHPNVPALYVEMNRPTMRRGSRVAFRSTLLCFVVYILLGYCGYLTWGSATESNILLNYTSVLKSSLFMGISFVGMMMAVMFAFPMNVLPCRQSVEIAVYGGKREGVPALFSLLTSAATVLLAFAIAMFIPSISIVFEFVGSTSGAICSFILPAVFFISFCPENKHTFLKFLAAVLGAIGLFVGFVGTTLTVMDITSGNA